MALANYASGELVEVSSYFDTFMDVDRVLTVSLMEGSHHWYGDTNPVIKIMFHNGEIFNLVIDKGANPRDVYAEIVKRINAARNNHKENDEQKVTR